MTNSAASVPALPGAARGLRLPALDLLRFLAATSVLFFHFTTDGRYPRLAPVTSYGWVGVELFFMISGFVICMSAWGRGLGGFAVSRIVRLYPAYWFAIVLTTALTYLFPHAFKPLPFRDVLLNLTMLQSGFHAQLVQDPFWTLWTELVFYLLFSVVVWRGLTYRRTITFCVMWLVGSVLSIATESAFLSTVLISQYSSFFVAGILLYLVRRFGPNALLWLLLGATFLIGNFETLVNYTLQQARHQPFWPITGLFAGFYAVLSLLALGKLDWLRWRMLTTLGAVTYPLYLVHDRLGEGFLHAMWGRLDKHLLLMICVAALLALAWLIHRLVERPVSGPLRRALQRAVHAINQTSERPAPMTVADGSPPQRQDEIRRPVDDRQVAPVGEVWHPAGRDLLGQTAVHRGVGLDGR